MTIGHELLSSSSSSLSYCSKTQFLVQVEREKLYDAYYKLTDSKAQINAYVYDVVRSSVPKINLDDVFMVGGQIKALIVEER